MAKWSTVSYMDNDKEKPSTLESQDAKVDEIKTPVLDKNIPIILLLMVSMMPVAVNACSTSTNPPICDPLPNGNGQWHAWQRVGSLGGIVDNFLQNYICSEGYINQGY